MRQESTGAVRTNKTSPRRGLALIYPSHHRHGLLASLFPRDYGRFLLIGLAGKAILLIALSFGFVIAAAFAAGRQDLALPVTGIIFAVYELFAHWRVSVLNRTLRPIRPAGVAVVVLALSGVWFLQVAIPSDWMILHESPGEPRPHL